MQTPRPPFTAAIFCTDGLLVDSERVHGSAGAVKLIEITPSAYPSSANSYKIYSEYRFCSWQALSAGGPQSVSCSPRFTSRQTCSILASGPLPGYGWGWVVFTRR